MQHSLLLPNPSDDPCGAFLDAPSHRNKANLRPHSPPDVKNNHQMLTIVTARQMHDKGPHSLPFQDWCEREDFIAGGVPIDAQLNSDGTAVATTEAGMALASHSPRLQLQQQQQQQQQQREKTNQKVQQTALLMNEGSGIDGVEHGYPRLADRNGLTTAHRPASTCKLLEAVAEGETQAQHIGAGVHCPNSTEDSSVHAEIKLYQTRVRCHACQLHSSSLSIRRYQFV
jgi:hypothetical protein